MNSRFPDAGGGLGRDDQPTEVFCHVDKYRKGCVMVIREMNREECLQVLARGRLARLACARENQPYIVPVFLDYVEASGSLYGFATPGQKVDWMRTNPQVCVEVDEITAGDHWVSVIVTGRFEELPQSVASHGAPPRAPERPRNVTEARPAGAADHEYRRFGVEQDRAWQVVTTHAEWWEPGCSIWADRVHCISAEPYVPIFYKVLVDHITGLEATRDEQVAIAYATTVPGTGRLGRLCKALSHVFGRKSKQNGSVH